MLAIPTVNLDEGTDSPKQARAQILEALNRINSLTQSINTAVATLLEIDNNVLISGNTSLLGNLSLQGLLSFTQNAGALGQVLASQGSGQPTTWANPAKYIGNSTSNLAIDSTSPKTIVVDKNLSYSVGQAIVVSNDETHYLLGSVQSYDSTSGNLTFTNTSQVGSGTFAAWTVNLTGATGVKGVDGATWYNGTTTPDPALGINKDYYIVNPTGDFYQKQSGAWTLLGNLKGPAGTGSGSGATTIYGNTNRYQASTTTGLGATIVSSASIKTGVSWTRTTTNLVVTDPAHGRSVGERAILRNANVSYFDSLITAADTNTFTVTTTDTGAASGALGAYSMGFTFAYIGGPTAITGCQIFAPANWDCVLLAVRLHMAANTRGATTHNVTVPKGNINGVGPQTSMDALSIPNQTVRQDGNTLSAVGATIAVNLSGDYGVYQFAALPAATTGIHIVMNF